MPCHSTCARSTWTTTPPPVTSGSYISANQTERHGSVDDNHLPVANDERWRRHLDRHPRRSRNHVYATRRAAPANSSAFSSPEPTATATAKPPTALQAKPAPKRPKPKRKQPKPKQAKQNLGKPKAKRASATPVAPGAAVAATRASLSFDVFGVVNRVRITPAKI
jgi:hypothetical protein